MKKILIVNIGTELGGVEKSLIEFLRFLSKEDCTVDLVLWKKRGPLFSQIPNNINIIENLSPGSINQIKSLPLAKRPLRLLYYIIFKLFGLFSIAWKCVPSLKTEYDIAISYCHNGYSPYYVIDKVKSEKKYLFYHHGSYEKDNKAKRIDKKYYDKYDKLITVSTANKLMLSTHFPELSNKISVINNLLNETAIIQKANEKCETFGNFEGCKICTVGRLSEEKGQLFALEVAHCLKSKEFNFKWIFVGDGPDKNLCEEKINQYGLNDCCLLIGAKTNPYPYVSDADLYLQPSLVESEGIAVIEALVLNKFIIATDIPAVREVLCNGNFGCLCDFNPNLIADKIIYYSNIKNQADILNNLSKNPSRNILIQQQIKELFKL